MSSRTATGTAASWCFSGRCRRAARRRLDGLRRGFPRRGCGRTAPVRLMRPSDACGTSRRCRRERSGACCPAGASASARQRARVRGNRASANLAGQPWVRERDLLTLGGGELGLHRCARLPDSARRTMAGAGQPGLPRYLGTGGAFGVRPVGRRACARALRTVGVPVEQSPERGLRLSGAAGGRREGTRCRRRRRGGGCRRGRCAGAGLLLYAGGSRGLSH